jgi:preprotein translocase subunit SecE
LSSEFMKTASMENTKDAPVKPRERAAGGPLEWWGRGRSFLTEVRAELRRVTWPSRAEVIATTWVVLLTSAFFGTYLWGLDVLFARLVGWAFKALGAA